MSHAFPDTEHKSTREFWAGAARGELVIPRCAGCRNYVWYPADTCPGCGGADMPWEPVSGRASLFSWALVERALFAPFKSKAPYVTGLVSLVEDPAVRIVTNIIDVPVAELEIGMSVHVVFRDLVFDGEDRRVPAPFFTSPRRSG